MNYSDEEIADLPLMFKRMDENIKIITKHILLKMLGGELYEKLDI